MEPGLQAGGWSHVLDGHDILNGDFQFLVGHGRDAKKMVEVHGENYIEHEAEF